MTDAASVSAASEYPAWEETRRASRGYYQPQLDVMSQIASSRPLTQHGERLPAPFQDYFALAPDLPLNGTGGAVPIERSNSYSSRITADPYSDQNSSVTATSPVPPTRSGHTSPFSTLAEHSIIPGLPPPSAARSPPPPRPPRSPSPSDGGQPDMTVFNTTPSELPYRRPSNAGRGPASSPVGGGLPTTL